MAFKILAIDDNEDNLAILRKTVDQLLPTAEILTATSGKKGIEIAQTQEPDVILLDIVTQSINGIEICKLLKADQKLKIIPVLFLTDLKTDQKILTKAIEAGGEAFLSKPFQPIELMAQVQAMIKIKAGNLKEIQKQEQLDVLVTERTYDIEQELVMRRKIEKELLLSYRKLKKTQKEKLFIIECQKQLVEMTDINKIYSFVGEKVKELIGDGYTVISMLDEKTEAMNIAAYFGFENKATELLNILKKDPREINFYVKDMHEDDVKLFRSGRLEKYGNGTYELLNKNIPKLFCKTAEEFLKIKHVYVTGFVSSGRNLGGLIILTEQELSDIKETVEILVNQAALTILRVKSEENLKKSEQRYKSIFNQSPFGIAIVNSSSRIIYNVNQKFADIIGRTIDDCVNLDWQSITHPDDIREDLNNMDMFNTGELNSYNMNKRYIKPDDSIVWINMTIAPLKVIGCQSCHICMIEDITEKKEKEQKIEYLYYHDVLTGLYNRTYFEEHIRFLENQRALPFSIIMGDINGLKIINDTLGHAKGDRLLIELADILRKTCRKNDVIARTGGDEFSILLPNTTNEQTQAVIERIYSKCGERENENDKSLLFLSISLGCATKTEKSEAFGAVIKKAEDHMYRRKLLEHRSFHNSVISSMRTTLFEKSRETEEHAARLVELSKKLGKSLGLKEEQLSELELLSTLHDIGKISIDENILTKADKLTNKEWDEIKKHPAIGYRITMSSPELAHISDYILCHHERWDGSGYPQGLSGENIPLQSRILAVIDAYDAMTNDRSYKKKISVQEAVTEIERNAGTQFDPMIAAVFIEIIKAEEENFAADYL